MLVDRFYKISSVNNDSHGKSMLKAISWRIIGTIDTIVISCFMTGTLSLALTIGSIEVFTKFFLYYGHERIWNLIKWK